jgi:lipid-A-disaccharide synthase-like uncharacterized protein
LESGEETVTLHEGFWLAVGATAQALFAGRMVLQWWASERRGQSIVPASFWLLSLAAGGLMLAYAVWRKDPIFICGQAAGLFVYARNVALLQRAATASHPRSAGEFPVSGSTDGTAARV